MKGLTTLAFFALMYLLLIIIFNGAFADPRGVQTENEIGQASGSSNEEEKHQHQNLEGFLKTGAKDQAKVPSKKEAKFGNVAASEHLPSSQKDDVAGAKESSPTVRAVEDGAQVNDTNPLADLFQVTDPNMRAALGAVYGSYKGSDQCSRKAFCMMGNYMKDMPGRDLVFLMMGNYVPKEYSLYYEIFKVAVLYGQNCNVYVCVPEPDPNNDAASSARPAPAPPAPGSPQASAAPNSFPR